MLKKPITYTDYNGFERTEEFYFNLSKAELAKLNLVTPGGLEYKINKMKEKLNGDEIISFFDDVIGMAYGEKSDDGKRFIKSPELTKAFKETEAYSELFMELVTNVDAAANFINSIIPDIPEPNKNAAANHT